MKKQFLFPAAALLGGVGAFVLRLAQNRTGFEAETGLAIKGNVPATALPVLLVFLAAVLLFMSRQLSGDGAFPSSFSTKGSALLTLPVAGCFLLLLSGAADLAAGLVGIGTLFPRAAHLLLGAAAITSAVCLLGCVSACRSGKWQAEGEFNGTMLLPVTVTLVVRLVLSYRVCSIDPTLASYFPELLAMVFLTLGFFRLSAFAFGEGKTPSLALYTALSVIFAMTALADWGSHITCVSSLLLYVGGAVTLLGFLLLRLGAPEPIE